MSWIIFERIWYDFQLVKKTNEGMELIPISTTQNNQGDCKFFPTGNNATSLQVTPPHVNQTVN